MIKFNQVVKWKNNVVRGTNKIINLNIDDVASKIQEEKL